MKSVRNFLLLNAAVINYTIPPDYPRYFHPPIKASGAKRAKKTLAPLREPYWKSPLL